MKVNSVGRKASSIRSVIFGVILLIFGVAFSLISNDFYEPDTAEYYHTTATITNIETTYGGVDESDDHEVIVSYTYDGTNYEGKTLDSYSSSMDIGEEIKIKIDIAKPDKPLYDSIVFDLVMHNIGYLIVGIGLIIIVSVIAKNAALAKAIEAGKEEAERRTVRGINYNKTYYFQFTGNGNRSHILVDSNGDVVYDGKEVKFKLVGNSDFEFTNYFNGRTEHALIGNTVTYNHGSLASHSTFKYNKVDVYQYIRGKGLDVEMNLRTALVPSYTVTFHGSTIAILEATSAASRGVRGALGNLPTPGCFSVQMDESFADEVFLVLVYLARTGIAHV